MEEITRQVRRAQRRLAMQRFVGALGWCWFVALLIALALIAAGKFRPLGVADWVWAVAGLAAGLAAAAGWAVFSRGRPIAAAIELDRRFGLKERVSSTLALMPEERETDAGRALTADAVRRVERIDVGEKFAVVVPRRFLLWLLPGAAALLVALFLQPAVVENPAEAKPNDPKIQRQIQKSTEELRRRLAERRKQAEKQQLPDAEKLLHLLEKKTEEFEGHKTTDRKQALAQLKDLTRDLQVRREKVEAVAEVQKQLEQLKGVDRGPADKLVEALKKGKLPQAADAIDQLKQQIEKSQLSQEEKEKLADQLDQMKQALEKMAAARDAAQADLQNRANQMRQAGQDGEADKLQQQLEKLMQQMPQMQQLDKLAEQLGQCAQCMRDGQMQDAQQAMKGMQEGLKQLQQQLDEMQLLDDAMEQLADIRDQLQLCDQCGGKGCEKCKGSGFGQCQGDGEGEGDGLGAGQGAGARPDAQIKPKFYDSQVRQQIGEGAADVAGMVDGPNLANRTEKQIIADVEAARQGSTDPLTGRRLPRKHREHAQEYFDRFREGK